MTLQADIRERLERCNDEKLLCMLDKPEDYTTEAIDYARSLLLQRGKGDCIEEKLRTHDRQLEDARIAAEHIIESLSQKLGSEHTDTRLDDLQRVSNYRLIRKILRPSGIGSIVFGLIAIAMGFRGMGDNPINVILGLIGIFLLVEGVWIVTSPTPFGMIVYGVALIIVGLWNIIITITNSVSDGGHSFFAILGGWQIIWGCQSFGRYKRFSKLPINKPSDETVKIIDDIVNELTKAKTKDAQDVIEFQTKNQIKNQIWKGRLAQDSAIFVQAAGQDVVFAKKSQVRIDKQGKVLIGKTIKAAFTLGDRNLNGTIDPDTFERYESWKNENQ